MATYISKYKGIRICIEPSDKEWSDKQKKNIITPGKYVKFENNRFTTEDKGVMEFLKEYIKKNNGIVWSLDARSEAIAKATSKIDAEIGRGRQGSVSAV